MCDTSVRYEWQYVTEETAEEETKICKCIANAPVQSGDSDVRIGIRKFLRPRRLIRDDPWLLLSFCLDSCPSIFILIFRIYSTEKLVRSIAFVKDYLHNYVLVYVSTCLNMFLPPILPNQFHYPVWNQCYKCMLCILIFTVD